MVATAGGDVGPRVLDGRHALPRRGRRGRALRARRPQHRRRERGQQSSTRRLRRLQPVGAALPRRRRRPHGGDRQAHHQRPRPARSAGRCHSGEHLRSRRASPRRGRRRSCSSAWPATAPGAPHTTRTRDRRTTHDTTDVAGAAAAQRPTPRSSRSCPATRRSPAAPGRPACSFAAAYPGTPSTEILETLAEYDDVYAEWSPNEKVALEVAIGASMAGARRSGLHEARGPQRGRRPVLLGVARRRRRAAS